MFEKIICEIKKIFAGKKMIDAIVLFGSVARGEAGKESDIDLFFVLSQKNKKAERLISETILRLEKQYHVKIQYIIADSKFEKINRQFLDTILREGVIIYGKLPDISIQKLDLEPYSLIKYSLSHLSQAEKMKIQRALSGKETQKIYKGKIYKSKKKGVLAECGGLRTGIASLLIPAKYSGKIAQELRSYGAQVRIIPAWLQKI